MKTKRCIHCKKIKNIDQYKSLRDSTVETETCWHCRTSYRTNKSKRAYVRDWEEIMVTWDSVIRTQM